MGTRLYSRHLHTKKVLVFWIRNGLSKKPKSCIQRIFLGKLNAHKNGKWIERDIKKPIKKFMEIISTSSGNLEWLQREDGENHSDYGDSSCGGYHDRKTYKKIMKKWIEIAKTNNIKYFLLAGTLLGALRNQDVIPYDQDLDIIIDGKDNMKLERIKNKRKFDANDRFHLILQGNWKLPCDERRRYDCQGNQVKEYEDQCSFQEPLGRLITENTHLDIYDYKIKNDKLLDP